MGGKGSVSRAETARVLGDIADAVRPVERARTAAAAERVLQTSTPGYGVQVSIDAACLIARDLGIKLAPLTGHDRSCGCPDMPVESATPGMTSDGLGELAGPYSTSCQNTARVWQRGKYAPWRVSPHVFYPDWETS